MANILEFLRGVLTDPETQRAYRADPEGFVTRSQFGDLTGEDVVEAIGMLRRSLPEPVAESLAPFDDEDELPESRSAVGERDIDAALRMLDFALDRVGAGGADAVDGGAEPEAAPEPEPERDAEPEPAAAEPEPEPEPVREPEPARAPEPARVEHHEPMRVESELDTSPAAVGVPPTPLAPVTVNTDDIPSVAVFSESLAVIATDARNRLDVMLRALQSDAEVQASQAREKLTEVLRRAEADANGIRQAAHDDAARLAAEAQSDREAARHYLDRTKTEADGVLERARQQADDARQQADDLLAAARAEDEAVRAELTARRAAMAAAEKELKERLAGLDSIFRGVLDTEES